MDVSGWTSQCSAIQVVFLDMLKMLGKGKTYPPKWWFNDKLPWCKVKITLNKLSFFGFNGYIQLPGTSSHTSLDIRTPADEVFGCLRLFERWLLISRGPLWHGLIMLNICSPGWFFSSSLAIFFWCCRKLGSPGLSQRIQTTEILMVKSCRGY